jgi:hypothetical protein
VLSCFQQFSFCLHAEQDSSATYFPLALSSAIFSVTLCLDFAAMQAALLLQSCLGLPPRRECVLCKPPLWSCIDACIGNN